MPSKAAKIFNDMKQTKAGWHTEDFQTLYSGYGFTMISAKKHDVYFHPKHPDLRDTIPRHAKELSKAYASDAVKNIETLQQRTKEDQDE